MAYVSLPRRVVQATRRGGYMTRFEDLVMTRSAIGQLRLQQAHSVRRAVELPRRVVDAPRRVVDAPRRRGGNVRHWPPPRRVVEIHIRLDPPRHAVEKLKSLVGPRRAVENGLRLAFLHGASWRFKSRWFPPRRVVEAWL
jgi:hypothetical protein